MSTTKIEEPFETQDRSWTSWQDWAFRRPKKSEIALQYLESFLHGLPTGEKLPSEREIATRLSITRSPVREALIALQMSGKIRIDPGVGAFYLGDGASSPNDRAFSLLAQSESPFEVRQLRQVLESAIVRAAIAELTPETLDAIEAEFNSMADAYAALDRDRFLEAHRAFHQAIAVASQNSLYERLSRWILYQVMTQPIWEEIMYRRLRETDTRIADSIEEHHEILEAIRDRNTGRAESLMKDHFVRVT